MSSVTVTFVLLLELSVFAFYQRNQASVQRRQVRDTARVFSAKNCFNTIERNGLKPKSSVNLFKYLLNSGNAFLALKRKGPLG